MAPDPQDSHELLIRIDERVKSIQENIYEINCDRRCHTHAEKFKTIERFIWGMAAVVGGLATRALYEVFK
ncbi:hypothetical protein [Maridesulfovibrio ferrireducens]|uniref:hypothetical protein n=1 Tax=Maridesulfovibrio ferrireducens TaxID=246191 RepID=UPI001A232BF9|nr:hypothetical protein [Maridesulfovibrio ferrireducens]MBI9110278.1 hypothetical protein [Maridesulfovibrio ferrireducens]